MPKPPHEDHPLSAVRDKWLSVFFRQLIRRGYSDPGMWLGKKIQGMPTVVKGKKLQKTPKYKAEDENLE